MDEQTKLSRWFCRSTATGQIEGPFDLIELAGLLRSGDVTGETLTQKEGDQEWVAFKNRQEFESAKNMPAEVIYQHLKDEKDEELEPPWSPRRLYYLFALLFGIVGYWLHPGVGSSTRVNEFLTVVVVGVKHLLGH